MIKIGITGGIGTGKTFVCKIFETLGVPVFYADEEAKLLIHSNPEINKAIINTFGEEAYQNGIYNRDYIAKIVFNDSNKLKKLNEIVHPVLKEQFNKWCKNQDYPYCLKETALLFETGSDKELDRVVVVDAPDELRISRILKRDPFRKEEEIKSIFKKQWSQKKKIQMGQNIIQNDGQKMLIPQVLSLHSFFLSLSTHD